MDQNREAAISELHGAKKFMSSMLEAKKKGIVFKGREIQLEIEGVTRTVAEYSPENSYAPVYFDIHGGGYAWGTIFDGDEWCALLAKEMGYHVFSLDYPLTPETEYPGQLEYAYQTIAYIRDHAESFGINPDQMLIGGRSAGGNLAAALCLYAVMKGDFSFVAQVLDHPWLDLAGKISWERRCSDPAVLPKGLMEMLAYGYAEEVKWKEGLVSPILADTGLIRQLPKTIIQTAEIDSLEEEGKEYARILEENGVSVIFRCAAGVKHGFTEEYTPEGEEGRNWLLASLKKIVEE